MSTCLRWTVATAVLLSILGAPRGASAQPGGRQIGGNIRFNSGQNVQPVFQGWSKNGDGSFTMHFGYFNRNYVEQPHVPIGAENAIQPGGPDRGQPSHFYPGFNRSTFTVVVPSDWGKKELIWTLTVHGRTDQAVAWLQPEWEIDPTGAADEGAEAAGNKNAPPAIAVEPASSLVTLPATLTLRATVTDDGLPPLARPRRGGTSENPPAFHPEKSLETPVNVPQFERPRTPARARLTVSWVVWRGPAGVTFDSDISEVSQDGKAITTATFSKPGEYVLRARAGDTKLSTVRDVKVVVASPSAAGQTGTQEPVTFTRHIAPIFQRSCIGCHRPGSIAPMSLVAYEEVRPWARAIKQKTSRAPDHPDRMPPWFVEKNVGIQKFKDDPSLSDEEVALIARWVDSGAPRGNPSDMPKIELSDGAWTIGTPDLIVSSPKMTLRAVAPDFYGRMGPAPTGLTEDRYIKAVEFRERRHDTGAANRKAGDLNYFVVHHAVIAATAGRSAASEGAEAIDQASGTTVEESRGGGRFNVVWELGQNSTIYPDVLGVKLPAGSALNYDLHLHSIGTEATFSIDVAFKFHPKGYKPKYTNVGSFASLTYDLDIPGNKETVIEALYPMSRAGLMLGFEPHLHSSGRRMCVEALYPSGYQETLSCAGYNHNWVKVYHYDDDVAPLLPKGTVIKVTSWYDNTKANPRVADPRNWKGWGSRSIDDMMFLLSRVIWLTDQEYEEEAAARSRKGAATQTGGNQG